ncbi:hypothetical protein [Methyloprofundus sp.]|uniref:hypothetical protein n=1 Tax=Methyloprofundus sp. TaxID=2020875 RepID=UPI003D0DEBB3
MKTNIHFYTIFILLAFISFATYSADQINLAKPTFNNLPGSPIYKNSAAGSANTNLLLCKTDTAALEQLILNRKSPAEENRQPIVSFEYFNEPVKAAYTTMSNGVTRHVTMAVAKSFFDFSIDGLAPKSIANFVSIGTQAFLPFEFANGVKITQVVSRGSTVIYRTEMPIAQNHSQVEHLALAGRVSTTSSVCNDNTMVTDLLERHIREMERNNHPNEVSLCLNNL